MAPSPNTRRNINRPPGTAPGLLKTEELFRDQGGAPGQNVVSWGSVESALDQDGHIHTEQCKWFYLDNNV